MRLNFNQKMCLIGQMQAGRPKRDVEAAFGVSVRTVTRTVAKFNDTGTVKDRPRPGQPRVTSRREDAFIALHSRRNRFRSAPAINRELQARHRVGRRRISDQTVRNRLRARGLRARKPAIRPKLLPQHREARRAWCARYRNWRLRDWNNVLFSDEKRLCLRHVDGGRWVYRMPGERYHAANVLEKTLYGGGSVMFWAGISGRTGKTDLVQIDGNLNHERYLDEIIVPHVLPVAERIGQDFVFQHDNARPHIANNVVNHLHAEGITVMNWPASSPDLNPIENLWSELQRAVDARIDDNTTLQELPAIVQEEWARIPREKITRLIRSMTNRRRECGARRGGHTHY